MEATGRPSGTGRSSPSFSSRTAGDEAREADLTRRSTRSRPTHDERDARREPDANPSPSRTDTNTRPASRKDDGPQRAGADAANDRFGAALARRRNPAATPSAGDEAQASIAPDAALELETGLAPLEAGAQDATAAAGSLPMLPYELLLAAPRAPAPAPAAADLGPAALDVALSDEGSPPALLLDPELEGALTAELPADSLHALEPAADGNTSRNEAGTSREALLARARDFEHVAPSTHEASGPARVHGSERANEILRQLRVHLGPDLRAATIELAPEELGRITIRLSLDKGRLSAALTVERAETLEILGRHLPELHATLAEQGIKAERFDLSLGFQDRSGERADRGDAQAHTTRATKTARHDEHEALARTVAAATGVDTYA